MPEWLIEYDDAHPQHGCLTLNMAVYVVQSLSGVLIHIPCGIGGEVAIDDNIAGGQWVCHQSNTHLV